jgi:ActR/RegA family two-component response regulator
MLNLNQQNVVGVVNTRREKKERKPKRDIDKEYPKWAWVDYKLQDTQFFKEVKELSAKGLDPKHVTTTNIATIFSNVKTFKTTNPLLSPNARKEIETL